MHWLDTLCRRNSPIALYCIGEQKRRPSSTARMHSFTCGMRIASERGTARVSARTNAAQLVQGRFGFSGHNGPQKGRYPSGCDATSAIERRLPLPFGEMARIGVPVVVFQLEIRTRQILAQSIAQHARL